MKTKVGTNLSSRVEDADCIVVAVNVSFASIIFKHGGHVVSWRGHLREGQRHTGLANHSIPDYCALNHARFLLLLTFHNHNADFKQLGLSLLIINIVPLYRI